MSKPWLQQPDETDKAYKGFECYLEERGRTQLEAYLEYLKWRDGDGKAAREKRKKASARNAAPGYFAQWCIDYEWARRRKAYYRHIDEEAYDELMESKKRRKIERIELLDEVMGLLGDAGLQTLKDALEDDESDVPFDDVIEAMDKLYRHYRAELDDLPTQTHDVADATEIKALLGLSFDDDDG